MGGASSSTSSSQDKAGKESSVCLESFKEDVPFDVLLLILSHVPAVDLLKNCSRVCKAWRDVISHPTLWHMKCIRDGRKLPRTGVLDQTDYKKIYVKNPYGRNLVRNPCAQENLTHWSVESNAGDRFKVERMPGAHCLAYDWLLDAEDVGTLGMAWATSYGWCRKLQVIDLLKEGCSEHVLDKIKPEIKISELYASRLDCGCKYEFEVLLLDKKKKKCDAFVFKTSFDQWQNNQWKKVEHTFKGYPAGVRFIQVTHAGKDTQFWAGHYGAKFTLTKVRVCLP